MLSTEIRKYDKCLPSIKAPEEISCEDKQLKIQCSVTNVLKKAGYQRTWGTNSKATG